MTEFYLSQEKESICIWYGAAFIPDEWIRIASHSFAWERHCSQIHDGIRLCAEKVEMLSSAQFLRLDVSS